MLKHILIVTLICYLGGMCSSCYADTKDDYVPHIESRYERLGIIGGLPLPHEQNPPMCKKAFDVVINNFKKFPAKESSSIKLGVNIFLIDTQVSCFINDNGIHLVITLFSEPPPPYSPVASLEALVSKDLKIIVWKMSG